MDPIEGALEGASEQSREHDEQIEDDPFEDEPYEVPEPPVTGDAMVDDATRRVALAAREPLDVQVAVYDAVHRGLQDRLADVED